jgi:hypothetical protein
MAERSMGDSNQETGYGRDESREEGRDDVWDDSR